MDLEKLLITLVDTGGLAGMVVTIIVLGLGFWVRSKGWTGFGDKERMVATSRLDKIDGRLGTIESRLGEVERDLSDRPTNRDLEQIRLTQARMDERVKSIEQVTVATNNSVSRIEDYMLRLSLEVKKKER